jgi:hypothetical protein
LLTHIWKVEIPSANVTRKSIIMDMSELQVYCTQHLDASDVIPADQAIGMAYLLTKRPCFHYVGVNVVESNYPFHLYSFIHKQTPKNLVNDQ